MANQDQKKENNVSLESVISTAIQIPGVKVNRELFLREQFKTESEEMIERIVAEGPVAANCDRNSLHKMATKIINERTLVSTGVSFVAGLPGGLAMAATIPADMLQFYGVALRMAQELAYLYGEADLWNGDFLEDDKVTNQLILYCGVMLGASGAAQAVRVMSSALGKQALKKLPQMALTKTFFYPIIKSVLKWFGVSLTKNTFAKGVSKAVPVLGGVVSGGITFATLRPMGQRLVDTLDDAHFSYTEAEFEADWRDIVEASESEENMAEEPLAETPASTETPVSASNVMEEIIKAKQLFDAGILTEQEFTDLKAKLIAKL